MILINNQSAKQAVLMFLIGPLVISIMNILSYIEGLEGLRMAVFAYILFMEPWSAYLVFPLIKNTVLEYVFLPLSISWMAFILYCICGGLTFGHKDEVMLAPNVVSEKQ
jgi:hypothetical protein